MIDIPKYEGYYAITQNGRVWSHRRGHWLKPFTHKLGYKQITLQKNGSLKCYRVHVLVAFTYIGERNKGMVVNHKNGIRDDNRLENLEWVTAKYNVQDGWARGRKNPNIGENHPFNKFSKELIMKMREDYSANKVTYQKLADKYGMSPSYAGVVVNMKKRKVS